MLRFLFTNHQNIVQHRLVREYQHFKNLSKLMNEVLAGRNENHEQLFSTLFSMSVFFTLNIFLRNTFRRYNKKNGIRNSLDTP